MSCENPFNFFPLNTSYECIWLDRSSWSSCLSVVSSPTTSSISRGSKFSYESFWIGPKFTSVDKAMESTDVEEASELTNTNLGFTSILPLLLPPDPTLWSTMTRTSTWGTPGSRPITRIVTVGQSVPAPSCNFPHTGAPITPSVTSSPPSSCPAECSCSCPAPSPVSTQAPATRRPAPPRTQTPATQAPSPKPSPSYQPAPSRPPAPQVDIVSRYNILRSTFRPLHLLLKLRPQHVLHTNNQLLLRPRRRHQLTAPTQAVLDGLSGPTLAGCPPLFLKSSVQVRDN